ncbi:MAG: dTDP-glucose 4,6-dehydratase [Candidatus Omnitrophica bacterium]|nr:dTDP-glucose 4,6-dehydratase [Candidatus Omnitrophota bacterium]
MKLLVTGGAGFIGSHFIRSVLRERPGWDVVNLDTLTYAGDLKRLNDVEGGPRYRFVRGDIADRKFISRLFAKERFDIVVNFAAETHVDRSILDPSPFLQTNVLGVQVLLEAARDSGLGRLVHISTDEVYGPILEGAHAETAPLAPRSPYAASKAAGDLLVGAYQATYGLPAVIVRPTNTFGPGQFPEKLIPLCITHAVDDQPIPVYGDGLHRRSWLFVADLCQAVARIAERGEEGRVYNVSSPWERPNLEVVQEILRLLGKPQTLIRFVQDRPGHDRRYAMDGARLSQLGWRATTSFEDGLRETVAWYRGHADWWQPLKARLREDPYHWLHGTPGSGARQPARLAV